MNVKVDKKPQYIEMRDLYHKKRDLLKSEINSNQIKINKHIEKINQLEAQISESRPKTEEGKEICPTCDVISMKHIGNTAGDCGTEHWYKCEIVVTGIIIHDLWVFIRFI